MKLVVEPEAAADINAAHAWYMDRNPNAAAAFLLAVREAADRAMDAPLAARLREFGLRRAALRRFPYGLFYVVTSDAVVVIACFHARRAPDVVTQRQSGSRNP